MFGADSSLAPNIDQLLVECKCKLGVAAQWLERPGSLYVSSSDSFPTASTYKLPIAIAFLQLVESRQGTLADRVSVLPVDVMQSVSPLAKSHPHGGQFASSELINLMITESDNSAADAILRLCGGPAKVTAYLQSQGIRGLAVSTSEREMDDRDRFLMNATTPAAMVKLLEKLVLGKILNQVNTRFLLNTMEQTRTFPNRIKGLLPPDATVGHKTGTGAVRNGIAWATNDVGLITLPNRRGFIALAIFLQDSPLDAQARDRIIARAAKLVYDHFVAEANTPRS